MKSRRASHAFVELRAEETRTVALEAIDRFARVLALTGISREQMAYAFHEACARVPKSLLKSGETLEQELDDAAAILALWLSDPNYLNQHGEPLQIRSSGPQPSLDALIKRVDAQLQLDRLENYLVRTGSVSKVGHRYAVARRRISLSRDPKLAYLHGLQAVLGLLRTIENNAMPKKNRRLCFESIAGNTRFPARLRAEFDTKFRRLGKDLLSRLDTDMQRAEQSRRPGEPTVRVRVGLFQCDENGHRGSNRVQSGLAGKSRRESRSARRHGVGM
jgi:hypothetical protein